MASEHAYRQALEKQSSTLSQLVERRSQDPEALLSNVLLNDRNVHRASCLLGWARLG